jgi:hypothetical protein
MNNQLREFERASGLDIYGLGARRDKWEAALTKYAELIVRECVNVSLKSSHRYDDMGAIIARSIEDHFGVEE